MPSRLEKLQAALARRIGESEALAGANVWREGADFSLTEGFSDSALSICVGLPLPQEASKYSALPAFSRVAISVLVEADLSALEGSPGPLAAAEEVSRLLHSWHAPLESGYSKIALDFAAPWARPQREHPNFCVCVNFTARSILE